MSPRIIRVVLHIYDDNLVEPSTAIQCVRESVDRLMRGQNLNDAMEPDEFRIINVEVQP